MKFEKQRRSLIPINAGSMADIAFLLLIFFLISTTIADEKGVHVMLPPYAEIPPQKIADKHVLNIKVNANNEVLIESHPVEISQLKEHIVNYISKHQIDERYADFMHPTVISFQNDEKTLYKTYVLIYSIIKESYLAIWDGIAHRKYLKDYKQLTDSQRKDIRNTVPMIISESEPFRSSIEKFE